LVLAPGSLLALVNHFKGTQVLGAPEPKLCDDDGGHPDLGDGNGQETAKRAIEIAAAGGHNLLMIGSPGSGKSMLAQRLPGLLPPLEPAEALEVSMIHSVAGMLEQGGLLRRRPFRDRTTRRRWRRWSAGVCGQVSLAHLGVLFLDELPEFPRPALGAAPAAGERPHHRRPRQRPRHLPGARATGGGDEPLPLRLA
jgi:magnesium chelatase family protein